MHAASSHPALARLASCLCLMLVLFFWGRNAAAAPRWVLVYGRQYAESMTGGVAGQAELFAFLEEGRPARVGMTNRFNAGTAIFGTTDTFGNSRIVFDVNNRLYDFHVFDPGTPSDSSPDCFWLDGLPHFGHYRFEFHWRKVSDAESVVAFPHDPAYHYDLVDGFNRPPNHEPAGFTSDAYGLTDWADFQAQTFVVPAGQNRVIAAKAFCVREHGRRFAMRGTIRRGGPTGPQVGSAAVSREVFSNEFPNVVLSWPLDAVPVVPGEVYALRLDSTDGAGFNVYATQRDNYPLGELSNGNTRLAARDMIAVVIAVGVEEGTPLRRGDCNQDGAEDVSDAVSALAYLFLGSAVSCPDACDSDDSGVLDLTDAVFLLSHLFGGGPVLPDPFGVCGVDRTEDSLACASSVCQP